MWKHHYKAVVCEANQENGTHSEGFSVWIELFRSVNRWFMTTSAFRAAAYVSVCNRFQSSFLCRQKCFSVQLEDREPRREVSTRHQWDSIWIGRIREFRGKFWVDSLRQWTFCAAQHKTRQNLRLGIQLASSTGHDRLLQGSPRARCIFYIRGWGINKVYGMRKTINMCCNR